MFNQFSLRSKSIVYPLALHVGLGFIIAIVPSVAFVWQLLVIGIGIITILRNRNRNDEAALWAAYFAGMEVFLRMTGQSIFWELGKYVVILFLTLGLLFTSQRLAKRYIIYFLLLVPSIFTADYVDFAEAKDMISFNLSGPLCLAVSCLYFYKKKYSGVQVLSLFRSLALPVIAMVTYLFFSSPDLSTVDFGSGSNFSASGGYGPNQVSLILGIGIFVIIIFQFLGSSFSGLRWLDYAIVAIMLVRALVTFSRGGVLGAGLAIAVFLILRILSGGIKREQIKNYFLVSLIVVIGGFLVWNYTNDVTQNALEYRYKGVNQNTGEDKEYTTGRIKVMTRDVLAFENNPLLGLGPGQAKKEGRSLGVEGVPAHTEWSRLLAEHGLFGLAALLILLVAPLVHIYGLSKSTRPLIFALFVLALFSMFHAAMRLSVISYIYAWALIVPVNEKDSLYRK